MEGVWLPEGPVFEEDGLRTESPCLWPTHLQSVSCFGTGFLSQKAREVRVWAVSSLTVLYVCVFQRRRAFRGGQHKSCRQA